MGGKSTNVEAPDFTELAEASRYSADLGAQLGQQQIAAAREVNEAQTRIANAQLDLARAVTEEQAQIARREVAIAEENLAMARDLYDYSTEFRPLERSMLFDVGTTDRSEEIDQLDQDLAGFAQQVTDDPVELYHQNRALVESQVGQALADAQGGLTRTAGQMAREGLRYGMSPEAAQYQTGQLGLEGAQMQAGTAQQARQQALGDIRARGEAGFGLRSDREAIVGAQRMADFGRQLDVAGLGRGLVGASQGAYGLASAGLGSAAQTQAARAGVGAQASQIGMIPGQQYMAGLGQGAGTIMSGQQMQIGGLSNIAGQQTSMFNTAQSQPDTLGTIIGTGVGAFAAGSDRRLKFDIEEVGQDAVTGLPLYEFRYKALPDKRYRGVMADDVEQYMPEAIVEDARGYMLVNYDMLGIEMVEVPNG